MPIYEFACPKCRKIYSFLSKRVNPLHSPKCPKCGHLKLIKEISRFAMIKGAAEPAAKSETDSCVDDVAMPDMDDPKVMRVMGEMEKDMDRLDENNPKHMAHMMKKLKEIMPSGSMPKEMDIAIKRLEAGEDPEKIEADMGDVLSGFMGDDGDEGGPQRSSGSSYARDTGLYDY